MNGFPNLYLYSDGVMANQLSVRGFNHLKGNLYHDFSNAIFRIIPVMNFKWSQLLIENVVEDDFVQIKTEHSKI